MRCRVSGQEMVTLSAAKQPVAKCPVGEMPGCDRRPTCRTARAVPRRASTGEAARRTLQAMPVLKRGAERGFVLIAYSTWKRCWAIHSTLPGGSRPSWHLTPSMRIPFRLARSVTNHMPSRCSSKQCFEDTVPDAMGTSQSAARPTTSRDFNSGTGFPPPHGTSCPNMLHHPIDSAGAAYYEFTSTLPSSGVT